MDVRRMLVACILELSKSGMVPEVISERVFLSKYSRGSPRGYQVMTEFSSNRYCGVNPLP